MSLGEAPKGEDGAGAPPTVLQLLTDFAYQAALTMDILVLVGCVTLLCRIPLSFSHPATPYLVFHVVSIPVRLAGLISGAPPLFAPEWWGPGFAEVTPGEILRATAYADLALVTMTAGWIAAARKPPAPSRSLVLPPRPAKILAVILLLAGLLGTVALALWPNRTENIAFLETAWGQSTWLSMSVGWPGLGLVLLAYVQGVHWAIVGPFVAYLGLMSIQGGLRFRVVVPLLMLAMIHVDQRKRRWPAAGLALTLVGVGVLFIPMKQIGRSIQIGLPGGEIVANSRESVRRALHGDSEFQFLDMLASTIALTDDRNSLFLGRTYNGLLTLPIPRPWWPDKPGLADYLFDLSTPQRPMGQTGMVITFVGECYTNFGLIGVAVLPFGAAYLLGRWHRRAYAAGYGTRTHFIYLLVACTLIQVYRDGLLSFVVFVAVYGMPLAALGVLRIRMRQPVSDTAASVMRIAPQASPPRYR